MNYNENNTKKNTKSWEQLLEYLADFNLLFLSVDDKALDKLLPYEKDNITSRVLTRNGTGTVELYAFDAEQTLYQNTENSKVLLQIVEGEATVIIGRKITQAISGMMLYIPAGTSYIISSQKKARLLIASSVPERRATSPFSIVAEAVAR